MSSKSFKIALAYVLAMEGGFVNDPNDRGGLTKFGISQKSFPDLDIENLTREQAEVIYREKYWNLVRCNELPGAYAVALFGAAVNHGQFQAVRLMQQALRVKTDGINGPITQSAARRQGGAGLIRFLAIRARFYTDITLADSSQARFLNGWFRRLFSLQQTIHSHEGDLRD
ncbi:MAG: peptidoglycan-binding protein [Candidatus Thiodiazotropha sp. (ex Ctena orbiculata)]|nr:peptidoglycan-binding protein [Candidatus Thiodiazotropha taylori]